MHFSAVSRNDACMYTGCRPLLCKMMQHHVCANMGRHAVVCHNMSLPAGSRVQASTTRACLCCACTPVVAGVMQRDIGLHQIEQVCILISPLRPDLILTPVEASPGHQERLQHACAPTFSRPAAWDDTCLRSMRKLVAWTQSLSHLLSLQVPT